jgi:acetyltransferase-like isoleucine patch superfamily enzyme
MKFHWAVMMLLLPMSLKRRVGRRFFGWDIHPTAHVGPSLIMVRHLTVGPGAFIGRLNLITQLEEMRLGEGAHIGARNKIKGWWLASAAFSDIPDRQPSLIMADYAKITADHYLDCVDRLTLDEHAAIAGFRSTVLTHTLDLMRDKYVTGPVEIGHHAVVMSGCTLLSGTRVPARSVVSAGSVVTTKLTDELTFYRGNPAEAIRPLPDRLRFFRRGETGPDGRALPTADTSGID